MEEVKGTVRVLVDDVKKNKQSIEKLEIDLYKTNKEVSDLKEETASFRQELGLMTLYVLVWVLIVYQNFNINVFERYYYSIIALHRIIFMLHNAI